MSRGIHGGTRRRAPGPAESGRGLVGRDLARPALLRRRAGWLRPALWLGLTLVAGLALAALRIDLIRVRYGLSEALAEERALVEERRAELARVGALRDPARLGRLASEGGFGAPERVIELPTPPEGSR